MGLALLKFILPAVSSVAFLPPIGFASKKNLQAEAFLFGFTTFFQIFYHLCNAPGLSLLFCLMGEELLEYFSVLSVILSTFATLINLTRYTRSQRLSIWITCSMLTAVRIYNTRKGYGIYVGPMTIASVLIALSWGQHMYNAKKLFPDKNVWLRSLIPGFCFIALSFVFLLCVENGWNFGFIHSFHHISLGIGLCFILNVCENGEKIREDQKPCSGKCGPLALCCCCV